MCCLILVLITAFVNNHYNDVRSYIGDNLLHLKCRLNMSHYFVLHCLKPITFIKSFFYNLPLYKCPIGDCLHELLGYESESTLPGFDLADVYDFFRDICLN